jgi:hypothetical protein
MAVPNRSARSSRSAELPPNPGSATPPPSSISSTGSELDAGKADISLPPPSRSTPPCPPAMSPSATSPPSTSSREHAAPSVELTGAEVEAALEHATGYFRPYRARPDGRPS